MPEVKVKDIVMGMACVTNSNWAAQYEINASIPAVCSYELLKKAEKCALDLGVTPHIGTIFSSDVFYDSTRDYDKWRAMGVKAVEMEAAALYMEAARAGKNALCICTVSDHMVTGESCSSEERQNSFTKMMEIALETA